MSDDDESDYEYDLDEPLGEDPDPPLGTHTLEQRKAVHKAYEVYEQQNGDERAPYTVMCGGKAYDLGICRHTDTQQIVGEWMWGQMILKNHNVMRHPIHVFRRHKLRYVYTVRDISREHEFTLVPCERVVIPAGVVQEALLEETLIGFRFINKTDIDREEGL